jgi:hypothetical protein
LQPALLCDHSLCPPEPEFHILHSTPPMTSHTDLNTEQFGKKICNPKHIQWNILLIFFNLTFLI